MDTKRKWDNNAVTAFWQYWSQRQDKQSEYFSYKVGDGIIRLLARADLLHGEVLDYGCGPGYLSERIVRLPQIMLSATDYSKTSVEMVNSKLVSYRNWRGANLITERGLPYSDNTFDLIICVEVVEHLLDEWLCKTMNELRRVLKPGGIAVFTTPNVEDLILLSVYCPFCYTEFHSVQHVRSFTSDSLQALLNSYAFDVPFCVPLSFSRWQSLPVLPSIGKVNYESLMMWLKYRCRAVLDTCFPRPFPQGRLDLWGLTNGPHLCAFGKKAYETRSSL